MGLDLAEMMHEAVEFGQRRPTIALDAFGRKAKFLGHYKCVFHRLSVQRIAPSRPGDRED
jgi:hypothetical protein